jgi:hypothetical protein
MPPAFWIMPGGFVWLFGGIVGLIISPVPGSTEPVLLGEAVGVTVGEEVVELPGGITALTFKLLFQDRNPKQEIRITAMIPSARMYFRRWPIRQLIALKKPFFGLSSSDNCKETC